MLAMAKQELIVPVQMARLCKGITVVNMTKPPAKTPEAPQPAMALPAISIFEEAANAQTKLPISNNAR